MPLSCAVVEYPCLASPGPSRTTLSQQLAVLACVLGFCLQRFVLIASIELPASLPELSNSSCLSFYSNMTLVLLCTHGASERSS